MGVEDVTRVNQAVVPTPQTFTGLCRFSGGLLVDGGLNLTGGLDHDGLVVATDPGSVAVVAGLSAVTAGDGVVNQTTLTLADVTLAVALATTAGFGALKLYDAPAGRILVLGVTASLGFVVTGEAGMAAAGSGDFSMGTTGTGDATLAGTAVNLLPSTAMTDPFVLGVGAATGAALAASAHFDGTSTAIDVYLNAIFDAGDVAAAFDALVSGTVKITWINLGDI